MAVSVILYTYTCTVSGLGLGNFSKQLMSVAVELCHCHLQSSRRRGGGGGLLLWWCHGWGCYQLLKAGICSSVHWPSWLALRVCLIPRSELLLKASIMRVSKPECLPFCVLG